MWLRRPDPAYTGSERARRNFWLAVQLTSLFVAFIWLIFAVDHFAQLGLNRFGLQPRVGAGLLGLLTAPLLHAGLSHIAANTLPLFVGGVALLFLYPNSALRALPVMYVGSNALAWCIGRPNIHIGASGLIYAILGFVFVSGLLRRDLRSIGVSGMIWFVYGSMLFGILPHTGRTSWEMHGSGLLMGVILAFVHRHRDQVPIKRYDWEFEEDEDGWEDHEQGNPDDLDGLDDPDDLNGSNAASNPAPPFERGWRDED